MKAQSDAITVTGTRVERPGLEIPASIDRIDADDIHFTRPMINLSESLGRVPGISVQNRWNYAQDLQISSRGFGGRSTFGVRGLRLIADGIPASFPDGQGQVSNWDLSSAERIEVLRGPFSVMYGNASGGVINIQTGRGAPAASADYSLGSFRTMRLGLQLGGKIGDLGGDGIASVSRFHTDGYRQHSAADRDLGNAKLFLPLESGANFTLAANYLHAPEAQDPLGLTRVQMAADPRQVAATAFQFNTRKTVRQYQTGANYTQRFSEWTLNATFYGGHRDVRQYLAIPLATQNLASHSGGVVDLDRNYGGAALRMTRESSLLGAPFTLMVGGDFETMAENRKGFINNNGDIAGLKRNEQDTVTSTGLYAQGEWRFADRWIALAGVRSSRVAFNAADYFIVPGNGDDSGAKTYSATTPVGGLLFRWSPTTSLYANAGRGFETPTFAELAYRPTGGAGLNFGLNASRSIHYEVGVKTIVAERLRMNAALFNITTRDEIAIATNAGGRSSFRNAGRTRREGVEFGASAILPMGFEAALAWTRLEAKFLDSFASVAGTPGVAVTVPAGSYLPGVPRSTFYADLRWRHAPAGFTAVVEYQTKSRVWVDDRNSEAADGYKLVNVAANFVQHVGNWRFTEYVRIDNLTNRTYAGSVIVNDANLRFYEPSPGRTGIVGVQARLAY